MLCGVLTETQHHSRKNCAKNDHTTARKQKPMGHPFSEVRTRKTKRLRDSTRAAHPTQQPTTRAQNQNCLRVFFIVHQPPLTCPGLQKTKHSKNPSGKRKWHARCSIYHQSVATNVRRRNVQKTKPHAIYVRRGMQKRTTNKHRHVV